MKKKLSSSLPLLVLFSYGSAQASTLITFNEYSAGTVITNQYQGLGVTFSGALGNAPIIADDGAMPSSPVLSPNPQFAGSFDINFATGASGVQFDSGYWNTPGSGVVEIYNLSGTLISTLTDNSIGVDHIDLSGFGEIGRIRFDSTADPAGADVDNLQFNATPEPATMLLVGGGFCLIGAARRRPNWNRYCCRLLSQMHSSKC